MTNYERLLKKYSKSYVPGECHSPEYQLQNKITQRIKNRHLILDELLLEIPFKLHEYEIQRIRYFIDTFTDFKTFHRRVSNETILLAFIFLMRTLTNPKTDVEKFRISKKYGLTNPVFRLIICRLNEQLMMTAPLILRQTRHYNQEILYKEGG